MIFPGQENLDDRLVRIRQVVRSLPSENFSILRRVTEHLDKYVFHRLWVKINLHNCTQSY